MYSTTNYLNLAFWWSLLNLTYLSSALQYDCSRSEYERCVRIADPLVKEIHFIFPDNKKDINVVCRTWNNFVDCLKKYTDRCFTDQQRFQFNKAVENPIESIHQMCMQQDYQDEYLRYAPCMKSTIVDGSHCGPYYSQLVEQVDQGDITSKATLCCSHDRFKQCVIRETRHMCDKGMPDGPAARFSAQIIDKALSFLQDQCYNYIPNSGDCSTITTDNLSFSDSFMISTSPSEVLPWSTVQEIAPKEIVPSRVEPQRVSASATSWLSSSGRIDNEHPPTYLNHGSPIPTQSLGTRIRPASYGRASSWPDIAVEENSQSGISIETGINTQSRANIHPGINAQPAVNTIQSYSDSTFTTPIKSSGSTVSTWAVVNPSQAAVETAIRPVQPYDSEKLPSDSTYSSSTTWYPAAGSQLSNEVDEPNQMGLIKPENKGSVSSSQCFVLLIAAALLRVMYN